MAERGTEFLKIDKQTVQLLQEKRDEAVKTLIPGSLSKEIYDRTTGLLQEVRSKPAGGKPN